METPQELGVIIMTEHETTPNFNKNALLLSYQNSKDEIDAAIMRVLESGRYILGEEVRSFEEEFARYIGVNYGIGVGSGTDAITLSLKACGIRAGDEVITVSHTAVATVVAIELSGATPVLVDICPDTYTLDPDYLQKAITSKTKAVLPVHLYGHPADMDRIVPLAHDHDLFVIEDCAQSHGALLHGRKAGSFGDIAAFSFYPTKNLGAIGDGGMVLTANPYLARQVRLLRQYGWKDRNMSAIPGLNSRLDEIQAAILRVKLPCLDQDNEIRRRLARVYDECLGSDLITPPITAGDCVHVYHQYVIQTDRRDAMRQYLADHGIDTLIHYPIPVHLQDAYREKIKTSGRHNVTEHICKRIISLPMHPFLAEGDIRVICDTINRFLVS